MSGISTRVGGRWMSEVAPSSPPRWTTLADGGSGEAEWRMYAPATFRHPAIRRGQLVEIRAGSANVWRGVLSEPSYRDDAGWEMSAQGLASQGEGYLAFTSGGVTTSTPDVAIDAAIARGLPWTRSASLSNAAFVANADTTDALNYLNDLLHVWAESASKRWGVDADGTVYAATDPTTPSWHMTPGSGAFGLADDAYASHVYLRYYGSTYQLATATAGDATAASLYGRREYGIDGRDYGPLTPTQATAYAQGLLDNGKARLGWTDTLEPTRFQLTTPGGAPAYLPMVKAQQMVRLHGVTDEQGQPLPYVDFVIGSTNYDAASDALSIAPVGLVARNLSDVLAVT